MWPEVFGQKVHTESERHVWRTGERGEEGRLWAGKGMVSEIRHCDKVFSLNQHASSGLANCDRGINEDTDIQYDIILKFDMLRGGD